MDVNAICGQRGVTVRPVPEGLSLPEEGANLQDQIAVLSEVDCVLDAAIKFWELYANQVFPVLLGGLSQQTRAVYNQVRSELAAQSGLAEQDIALDVLLEKVIERMAGDSNSDVEDLATLRGFQPVVKQVFDAIREELTSQSEHPLVAEAYAITHIENRILRLELKAVIERLIQELSPEIRAELNLSQISWDYPPDNLLTDINKLKNWIGELTQLISDIKTEAGELIATSCTTLAGLIPEPPIITPPVIPPTPPVTQPERPAVDLDYELSASPAYGFLGAKDQLNIFGQAGIGFGFSEKLKLQLDYQGFLNLSNLSTGDVDSRSAEDAASVTFSYLRFNFQGSFLYATDFVANRENVLGGIGIGYSLWDDNLYPFIGGLLGTSSGALAGGILAGARGGYRWEDLMGFNLGGQIYYEYFNAGGHEHEVGGRASVGFSPYCHDEHVTDSGSVKFLGNCLNLSIFGGGYYSTEREEGDALVGLQFGFGGLPALQPFSLYQAVLGGF